MDGKATAIAEAPAIEIDVEAMVLREKQARKCVKRIGNIDREIRTKEGELEEVKGTLKALEGEREQEVAKLIAITSGAPIQADLPFADKAPADGAAEGGEAPADAKATAWRVVPLSTLGIAQKAVEALAEADIRTIGDLSDRQQDPRWKLTDVKGIGEGTAAKIETALEKYWAENPPPAPAPVEPTAPASTDAPAEDWTGIPVTRLDIPELLIGKLVQRGINTLGDWSAAPARAFDEFTPDEQSAIREAADKFIPKDNGDAESAPADAKPEKSRKGKKK